MLCDRTECDMRSCLNTLQFLARRNARITQRVVEGAAIGTKDTTRGAFALWNDLLQVTWEGRGGPKHVCGNDVAG